MRVFFIITVLSTLRVSESRGWMRTIDCGVRRACYRRGMENGGHEKLRALFVLVPRGA
jgi:hypothetical protein